MPSHGYRGSTSALARGSSCMEIGLARAMIDQLACMHDRLTRSREHQIYHYYFLAHRIRDRLSACRGAVCTPRMHMHAIQLAGLELLLLQLNRKNVLKFETKNASLRNRSQIPYSLGVDLGKHSTFANEGLLKENTEDEMDGYRCLQSNMP